MALSWPSKREGKIPLARENGEGPKGGERGARVFIKDEREGAAFLKEGALLLTLHFGGRWPKP